MPKFSDFIAFADESGDHGLVSIDAAQPNRAYDILERKFRRAPDGRVRGWGLKVLP